MADDAQKLAEVQAILKIKDYYQLLGVGKDADQAAIKNAYKKLALKFHPDKNKAQGAKEAFNKVSNAYETLSNADKRASYDRYGSEEDLMQERANRQRAYAQREAEEFDHFNDIFMQFFGGMHDPNFRMQRRGFHFQQRAQPQEQGLRINFVPFFLLIVLAMSFLPRLFETKPYFSFEMSNEYKHKRQTSQLKTLFFARQGYFEYVNNRHDHKQEIDRKVDQTYIRRIYQDCQNQKMLKRRYLQLSQTSMYNRQAYAQQASKVDMSSCNRLNFLQQNHAQYFQSLF